MRLIFSFLFSLVAIVGLAYAQQVEEHVRVVGVVSKAWVIIADADQSKVVPAAFEMKGDEVFISALLSGTSDSTLVATGVELVNGEVHTTALHSPWVREVPFDSGAEKLSEEARVRNLVEEYRRKLKRLEGELQLVTLTKRQESGLDEIDKLYEKIAFVEMQRQELTKAPR